MPCLAWLFGWMWTMHPLGSMPVWFCGRSPRKSYGFTKDECRILTFNQQAGYFSDFKEIELERFIVLDADSLLNTMRWALTLCS